MSVEKVATLDVRSLDDETKQCESRTVFAKNLSYYIECSGETQKDIAAAINVSTATFNNWVTGQKYPRPEKVEKLARYFGITIGDLIEEQDASSGKAVNRTVFAKNLAFFAQRSGLTQNDIARKTGKSKSVVSNWFNARNYPRIDIMEELANILDVSIADLVDESNDGAALSDERVIMAQNIKYYLEVKGVSRKQLCAALGLNYNTLSSWLQGEKYPRIEKIVAMADYFGCNKSDLVEKRKNSVMVDGNERHSLDVTIRLDSDTIELIGLYQRCDNEQRRCIKQMVKYITLSVQKDVEQ